MGDNIAINSDRYFVDWLATVKGSILVCGYKNNTLFAIGHSKDLNRGSNIIACHASTLARPMVVFYDRKNKQLVVGTKSEIIQYHNDGSSKTNDPIYSDFDTTLKKKQVNITNDIDIHDVVIARNNKIYFCSSLFNCVCQLSSNNNFDVHWKPPWVNKIAQEDRCHLNGLCCVDGIPKYITAVSRGNFKKSWYENRENKGIVYDIIKNKLICKNLTMPHSPTYYNEKLWLLDSGSGYFGYVDLSTILSQDDEEYHPFVPEVFLPGFIRGMSFVNDTYVIIGCSLDRHDMVFSNLPLNQNLKDRSVSAKCGIYVINITTMNIVHEFIFTSGVVEVYDISFIPDSKRTCVIEDENTFENYTYRDRV